MKTSSYIISAAQGGGVYRHIRISSDSTLEDLHIAIAAAFKLEGATRPSFMPLWQHKGEQTVKYSINNTKTTASMRYVKLKDTAFAAKGTVVYTLAEPRLSFNCRTLRTVDEPTTEPQVVRASGGTYPFRIAFAQVSRALADKGIPLNIMSAMAEFVNLPKETLRLVADYFLAASNLYGLVPLKTIHQLYIRNHPPISLQIFIMIGIALSHQDRTRFYLLDRQGKVLDKENYKGKHAKFIAEFTVVESGAFGYVRAIQEGKPYYLPAEKEFLRYADDNYIEHNEHFQNMKSHLLSLGLSPDKAKECMLEFSDSIKFSDNATQEIFDTLESHQIRLKDLKAATAMMDLYTDLSNNTRTHLNCGHTPIEIGALMNRKSGINTANNFVPAYRPDPLHQGVARKEDDFNLPKGELLPFPLNGQVIPKPGRNDPCPCGSGKKFKNCCGKPGV